MQTILTSGAWKVLLAILALAVSHPQSCEAKRLFVAQTETASDTNPGTSRRPFRTIGYAVSQATPGDRVIVREGDYRKDDIGWGIGIVPVLSSGESGSPIRIRADKNAEVLVQTFLVQNCEHLRIEGFRFQGTNFCEVAGWRDMPCIVRDEARQANIDFTQPYESRQAVIEAEFATYLGLSHSLEYATAIDLEQSSSVVVRENFIDGYWAGVQSRGSDRVTIHGNRIRHCVNGVYSWAPAPSMTDSMIRSNDISQCLDNGIDLRQQASNVKIQDNVLYFNGRSHIAVQDGSEKCKVRDNLCFAAGYYSETMQYPGSSAISLNQIGPGVSVEGNYVAYQMDLTEIDGNGVILDLVNDQAKPTVSNNTMYRNAGAGVNTTISPESVIRGNLFLQNGYGSTGFRRGGGVKLSRSQDVRQTIIGNHFLLNRTAGILTDGNLAEQLQVDGNVYWTWCEPLIWDGFSEEDKHFRIRSLRRSFGWERSGWAWRLCFWCW